MVGRVDKIFQQINAATSRVTGEDYCRSLTRQLAQLLDVRFAFISRLTGPDPANARTVALWSGAGYMDNFNYDMIGTPGEMMFRTGRATFSHHVQQDFPEDRWLQENDIQSYVAVPVKGASGALLGQLGIMCVKPINDAGFAESVLTLFADRVATELKWERAERILTDRERRFYYAVYQAGDGFFLHDRAGKFLDVNLQACENLGYSREELLQLNVRDVAVTTDDRELERLWANMELGKRYLFEAAQRCKDGSTTPVEIHLCRFESKGQELFLALVQDISLRKETVRALHAEQVKAQQYLDIAEVIIVATDINERVTLINQKGCEVLGYRQVEIIGTNWFDLCIPSEQREKVRGYFHRLLNGELSGCPGIYENAVLTKSGEERIIDWHNTVVRDGSGKVTHTLSSGRDVTESNKTNAMLEQALREVQELRAQLESENIYLQEEIRTAHSIENIVARDRCMLDLLEQVVQVAPTETTVLIQGETGTGKELIARILHSRSARSDRPLIKVNCGAIPTELVESELFGHEKGAFTGAITQRIGRFELADRGTIFLDEISELPISTQVKLLRVLQEQEFERVGGSKTLKIDVRVIAATNRDLEGIVEHNEFRRDLYYRVNVFPLMVPPLRERMVDIPSLIEHIVEKFSRKLGKPINSISRESMELLKRYPYPGNVRELENIIERAMILGKGPRLTIDPKLLPETALQADNTGIVKLVQIEHDAILRALKNSQWIVSGPRGAANVLGLNPNTLRSRMRKLKIKRPN